MPQNQRDKTNEMGVKNLNLDFLTAHIKLNLLWYPTPLWTTNALPSTGFIQNLDYIIYYSGVLKEIGTVGTVLFKKIWRHNIQNYYCFNFVSKF